MIYLDYVATTPLNGDILNTYHKLLSKYFANSDSSYKLGYEVNRLLEKSRETIASLLDVNSNELIFTSCASEANNLAIKGTCFSYMNRGKHIITTAFEHSSVTNTFKQLEEVFGFEVDYISVDSNGHLNIDELKSLIREDTILVSTMYVNNEIGTINDVEKISKIIKEKNPKTKYHIDCVQALGKLPLDLSICDLASFSAHKIYGLKGSGLLYKKQNTSLVSLITAGQQEFGLRGGTENACTHIVLAKTIRMALEKREDNYQYVKKLNDYLRENLKDIAIINSPNDASPYILNISLPHYKPEVMVHYLEEKDIYISTKSACTSKKTDISHTLESMHLDIERASSALRISLSSLTTINDLEIFVKTLNEAINTLRKQR